MQCLPGIEILLPGIKYVKFYFCHEKLQSTEDRAKPVSMQAMIVAKYWRNCLNYFGAICGNIANGSNLSQIKESQLPWLRWCSQGCRAAQQFPHMFWRHYEQDLTAAANCTFLQFPKSMPEEVLLMPKEIVYSASEGGGNDTDKRKLIIDTVFLSGAVKHPAFLCLDQVPSFSSVYFYFFIPCISFPC